MVRATHGVHRGSYYWELEVLQSGPDSHIRVGWSTRQGELQGPVGFDQHSYAYRDVAGSIQFLIDLCIVYSIILYSILLLKDQKYIEVYE